MKRDQFIKEVIPYGEKLFRIAFRLLNDKELAKDVVQDVYTKLWIKRDELVQCKNMGAYLFTVTRNACLDKLRLMKNTTDISKYEGEYQPDYAMTDTAMMVRKLINKLPEQQKKVIEMRDVEGFTIEEITELLDISGSSVRANLSIARKKLRDEIILINNYGLQKDKNTG